MGTTTLAARLTEQLRPIAELVDATITAAYKAYSMKALTTTLPEVTRDAHRARVSGLLVWQHVADRLVAVGAANRFPDGFAVLSSDKEHNSGRYLFRFPGGLLTIRQTPHDDDKDEGQFMQDSFQGMIEQLDKDALPDEREAARVWLKIDIDGASTFAAEDRHGHQVKVRLADLLLAETTPTAAPVAPGAGRPVRRPVSIQAPNFRMLRLARELRGVTQTDLARAAGIPQARLSRMESGQLSATDADTTALAAALELPVEFLAEPGIPAAVPLFRKRAIRSVRRLTTIQARLNTAVLIAQRLLDAGIDLDPPQTFPDPGEFPAHEPVLAAQELRRAWRLPIGRIDDLTAVIESAAGLVLYVDFGAEEATAAFISTPGDERMWFLLNTRESSGDRLRLSLAHELAHAVLHRRLPSADEAEQELEAFQFAAELLLPADTFDRAVPYDALTLATARALKETYWVSIQAIIRAAYDRRRISRARYTSLYKQLSARGWRTQEPVSIDPETPRLWPEVLRVHRQQHGFSDAELAATARVTPATLADLFPRDFQRDQPSLRLVRSSMPS